MQCNFFLVLSITKDANGKPIRAYPKNIQMATGNRPSLEQHDVLFELELDIPDDAFNPPKIVGKIDVPDYNEIVQDLKATVKELET